MSTSQTHARSGVEGLDEVLGGGFPRNQTYLIHGPSGAGKTTLCLQFLMEGAKNGETALYLGTSETVEEIGRVARSHGWSLDGVHLHHQSSVDPADDQTMLVPAEIQLPQTVAEMLEVVNRIRPDRLVIDSLAEIRSLAGTEHWYRRQLLALKNDLVERNTTSLLVEIPDVNPVLSSIVTGVVNLEYHTPAYGPTRRRLRVAKIRGQSFNSGYHDLTIETGGLIVYPRLIAAQHRRRFDFEQVSTGLSTLDDMLGGGLIRGTSTLLVGPSGTAKSLLATQLAVAAAQRGERSLLFVFDERVQTLFQRSEGVGLSLQRFVDQDLIEIRQIDPGEVTCGQFSDIVKKAVENNNIKFVIVDSLNGYGYAMPEENALDIHLHELSSYLNQQAVTSVFIMTQHGLLDNHFAQAFDASYVANIVILMRLIEFSGRVHKVISVYKNRSNAHDTALRELLITDHGLQVGPILEKLGGVLHDTPDPVGGPHDSDTTPDA